MYIEHSAKGTHWTKKKHKYINKIGGRYIYPSEHDRSRRADHAERKVWDYLNSTWNENTKSYKRSPEIDEKFDKLKDKRNREFTKYYEAKGVEARKQFEDPKMYQHRDRQKINGLSRMNRDGTDDLVNDLHEASINENASKFVKKVNKIVGKKDVDNNDRLAKKLAKTAKKYNAKYGKDSLKDSKKSRYDNSRIADLAPMKTTSKGQKAVESILEKIKSGSSNKNLKQLKKDRKNGLLGTREYRTYHDGKVSHTSKQKIYDTYEHARKAMNTDRNSPFNEVHISNQYDKINNPMGEDKVQRDKKGRPLARFKTSTGNDPYEYYNRNAKSYHRWAGGYTPLEREQMEVESKMKRIGEEAIEKRNKKNKKKK